MCENVGSTVKLPFWEKSLSPEFEACAATPIGAYRDSKRGEQKVNCSMFSWFFQDLLR